MRALSPPPGSHPLLSPYGRDLCSTSTTRKHTTKFRSPKAIYSPAKRVHWSPLPKIESNVLKSSSRKTLDLTKGTSKQHPTNYFDRFTRMYAELQYQIFTIHKRKPAKACSNTKAEALEEEMRKICSKASPLPDSISKASALINKFNKIKTRRNYYVTANEFSEYEVHLINESDSEVEQIEAQLSDKIRAFLERNVPLSLATAVTREQLSLIPHMSYHIGSTRDLFVEYNPFECNVSQGFSSKYSRDKKVNEKVFGTVVRGEHKHFKDPPVLRNIKRFGHWEVCLLSGDKPKSMRGKAFGGGDTNYFHSIGANESVAVYSFKINTCKWNKIEFKASPDIPAYIGEATGFYNGKIISHSGLLPPNRYKQEADNELRIFDLSCFQENL